jgi:thiamine-phosphate pyrophosphorylase
MLPLTPAVARALEVARCYALGQGVSEVEPLHVLHGLLEEEEGRAATLLAAAGLNRVLYQSGRPPRQEEGPSSLPLSDQAREAFSLAAELAVDLTGERTLSSEPVLLGLLQTDSALTRGLTGLGLDLTVLEANLHRQKPPVPHLDEPLHLVEGTERMDTARILDVGANRAREALRVIEDYCRFVLEDGFLSGELKKLRHDFTEIMKDLLPVEMREARDVLRDVGTQISTEAERTRSSLVEVVQVNWKRLQEALRSLEEFGKVVHPESAEQLEQMRYRAYTLERTILSGQEARARLQHARLYVLLSGSSCASSLGWTIEQAAEGGAAIIQLREKTLSDRELLDRARRVRQWTRKAGVLFIVNDRPDVARLVEADGVHLGQDDMPVKDARRILGPEAIIGVSTHSLEQVRQAILDGAGYIGVGPTFPSGTKAFDEFPGLTLLRQSAQETNLPTFAIGGIDLRTIAKTVEAGARRVAVSQAIARSEDPRSTAAALLAALR